MKRGKTEFTFTVNVEPDRIEGVIRSYLQANKFKKIPKPGANYYYFNDPIIKGKRSIEYYIEGNQVRILAYLGKYENPMALEGTKGWLTKQEFINDLEPLVSELKKLATESNSVNCAYTAEGSCAVVDPDMNNFIEEAKKKLNTWTVIGFVMSIIGVLLSFIGITYGFLLILIELNFGVQGLHTEKKGLAVSTIVLAFLSIILLIFRVVTMLA